MQRKTLYFLLLTLLTAFVLVGCSTPGEPEEMLYGGNVPSDDEDTYVPYVITGVDVGNEAPDFTLADTYGDNIALADLRGKPVLLFFWATGCPACEQEYPRMQDLHETYSDSMTLLSVNLGDDSQLINAFMADYGMTFDCVVATADMQEAYEAYTVPNVLVLDAEGMVTFNNHPGYLTEAALQEEF